MPHISITLYKGRDRESLEKIAKTLQESLNENWGPEALSVSVKEVEPAEFRETVEDRLSNEELFISSDYVK